MSHLVHSFIEFFSVHIFTGFSFFFLFFFFFFNQHWNGTPIPPSSITLDDLHLLSEKFLLFFSNKALWIQLNIYIDLLQYIT